MPTLLTVAQIRGHIETDLTDEALQRLIDDADAEIIAEAGAVASHVDTMSSCELANVLFLSRRASTITTVVERVGDDDTTLDATDYELKADGLRIERLDSGPNPRATWGEEVVVTYAPRDMSARRLRVEIDLVRLAAEYDARKSSSSGDWSQTSADYEGERSRILSRLHEGLSIA